ncbi:MAG: LysR family transcriptional regulator [Rhodobacteraceae bacterium]|jgi:DNA-binding transcriptional LysR family regulator|nr:LysR family transcriptional regulator [Paracoccaceae bacterium]
MDRLSEMEAFATVIDQGSYTGAARRLGVSKSSISKQVSALEERLGATLLHRTTRRISPTEIGLAYYDRARRVLNDAGEADAIVNAMQSDPSGPLRMSVVTDFGVQHLPTLIGEFLRRFPKVTVDLVLNNRRVDLAAEGFDLAIWVGEPQDPSLKARRLCTSRHRLVASPSYFQGHGRPMSVDDLTGHRLLHTTAQSGPSGWRLTSPNGEVHQVRAPACLVVNDAQSLLNAVTGGLGIAFLPDYVIGNALNEGLLEEALPALCTSEEGIYAVHPVHSLMPPKVRAMADFLTEAFGAAGF